MARTTKKQDPAKSLEQRLWEAADALRGNQEPSEYKHVVLGQAGGWVLMTSILLALCWS